MQDFLSNTVALSRLQFAVTAIFHMLWPVLTTGMGIYLVIIEGLWLKTRNLDYYHHARFWARLYVLNFGIGVATGLPMAFQFGLNWAPFSESVGDFFGTVLGFEGTMAFMLEASFLGIMLFGWDRVPPLIHYLATILVAIGANLSTFWILSANSWLQTPAGGIFVDGKFVVQDYFAAIANPFMVNSFPAHVLCHFRNLYVCHWGYQCLVYSHRSSTAIFCPLFAGNFSGGDGGGPSANFHWSFECGTSISASTG